jgi:hypothetical protein
MSKSRLPCCLWVCDGPVRLFSLNSICEGFTERCWEIVFSAVLKNIIIHLTWGHTFFSHTCYNV